MDISKKTLNSLYEALPEAGASKVAASAGFSVGYTCKVLTGKTRVTKKNMKIIDQALLLVAAEKEATRLKEEEIKTALAS